MNAWRLYDAHFGRSACKKIGRRRYKPEGDNEMKMRTKGNWAPILNLTRKE